MKPFKPKSKIQHRFGWRRSALQLLIIFMAACCGLNIKYLERTV